MAKILVVDDEASIRNMITAVLRSRGHEPIEADNGISALDMVKHHSPQLIISDVNMVNMNGFMLREILQQDQLTARIPMIMMTGIANDAGAWQSDPSVKYLSKPFKIADLMSLVNEKLNELSIG
ncbi:MAG: response regulator [Bacteroidetes bacterium]|nr:response regulator [Bacteroidota bacterium]